MPGSTAALPGPCSSACNSQLLSLEVPSTNHQIYMTLFSSPRFYPMMSYVVSPRVGERDMSPARLQENLCGRKSALQYATSNRMTPISCSMIEHVCTVWWGVPEGRPLVEVAHADGERQRRSNMHITLHSMPHVTAAFLVFYDSSTISEAPGPTTCQTRSQRSCLRHT
jgi:hypothetical protein